MGMQQGVGNAVVARHLGAESGKGAPVDSSDPEAATALSIIEDLDVLVEEGEEEVTAGEEALKTGGGEEVGRVIARQARGGTRRPRSRRRGSGAAPAAQTPQQRLAEMETRLRNGSSEVLTRLRLNDLAMQHLAMELRAYIGALGWLRQRLAFLIGIHTNRGTLEADIEAGNLNQQMISANAAWRTDTAAYVRALTQAHEDLGRHLARFTTDIQTLGR